MLFIRNFQLLFAEYAEGIKGVIFCRVSAFFDECGLTKSTVSDKIIEKKGIKKARRDAMFAPKKKDTADSEASRKYRDLLLRVSERRRLVTVIELVDCFLVCITALVYLFLLVASLFSDDLHLTLFLLIIPGAPFVAVSLLRRVINAPRPYEIYDIPDLKPGRHRGRSFPSRHAFSAFAIGTLVLGFLPVGGALLLLCGVLLSVARVLLGRHFPRDVIAGAIVGTVTSALGLIIMNI